MISGAKHYHQKNETINNLDNTVKTEKEQIQLKDSELEKLNSEKVKDAEKIKQLEEEKKKLEADLQAKLERKRLVANDPCRLVYDYSEWDARTMYGICKAESKGNVKAVGDTTLTFVKDGVTYGMSCGMLQVRILPGRNITCEDMHNPENNVAKAFEIWKAQSYTAWSMYTNGKYLDYI